MNLNEIYDWYKSQGLDPWNFNCKEPAGSHLNS